MKYLLDFSLRLLRFGNIIVVCSLVSTCICIFLKLIKAGIFIVVISSGVAMRSKEDGC